MESKRKASGLMASLLLAVSAAPGYADDIGHGKPPSSAPSDPVETENGIWEELLEWFETDSDQ